MITVLIFIGVLALLVLVHELGHFLTARKFGIFCDEFGFGFPPRIFGVQRIKTDGGKKTWRFIWGGRELTAEDKKHSTVYSLNWIPLGGFVKIKGENDNNDNANDSFGGKPAWKRSLVLVAGVVMNFILAGVLFSFGMMLGVPQAIDPKVDTNYANHRIQVTATLKDTPAEKSGIKPGDFIINIDNKNFASTEELSSYVGGKAGQNLNYNILRGKENLNLKITPVYNEEAKKAAIGISILDVGIVKYVWYMAIWEGFKSAGIYFWMIVMGFVTLITGLFKGQSAAGAVAGPIGIAQLTGQMADMGFIYLVQFAAVLSLNLAFINILPIPALDGGRLLFILIEKLRGKPVNEKIEAALHNAFFILLLVIIVLVTWKDISALGCLTCKLGAIFK